MDAKSLSLLFILNPQMFNGPQGLDDMLFIIQLPCQIQNDLAKQKLGLESPGNAAIAVEGTKGQGSRKDVVPTSSGSNLDIEGFSRPAEMLSAAENKPPAVRLRFLWI
jgi:hypothetical protein